MAPAAGRPARAARRASSRRPARRPGCGAAAEPHGGSGLGLAVTAAIAEGHGGRLQLDTAPEEGCTFLLVLPSAGFGRGRR
ncbi:ATP-binding protein [Streptomyces sp. NBC_00631]|uniref:ATP-binding protein n=1 Tax=Streptomyces sp. NBC_00631 TaxID=2975793 RepID=UPI0038680C60